jgi:hypothetical protein
VDRWTVARRAHWLLFCSVAIELIFQSIPNLPSQLHAELTSQWYDCASIRGPKDSEVELYVSLTVAVIIWVSNQWAHVDATSHSIQALHQPCFADLGYELGAIGGYHHRFGTRLERRLKYILLRGLI